jgi:predicted nucleic acid-binding protein
MKALLDTNILIDYLNGIEAARDEIQLYETPAISIITWMEVMVGCDDQTEKVVSGFLNRFDIIQIDRMIAKSAVAVRKQHRMKLPDAIIFATAKSIEALLVTRNTKDFDSSSPQIRVPYGV